MTTSRITAALIAWGIGYLFAQKSKREPECTASLVFCSTVLSLIYLPILLAILMHCPTED